MVYSIYHISVNETYRYYIMYVNVSVIIHKPYMQVNAEPK